MNLTRNLALLLLSSVFLGPAAWARVFNSKESSYAAYIRGTGGQSNLGYSAYADSSGDQTNFQLKDKPAFHYSGEAGVMFIISDRARLRVGIEGLQTREVEANGLVAHHSAMTVTSSVLAVMPMANLELDISAVEGRKYFMFAGVGYAKVTSSNRYALTALGKTTYGLTSDYKETVSGNAITGQVGLGAEWNALDNVSLSLEAGYRYLVADKLNYENTQNTAEGSTVDGGAAKIDNGTKARELDLSGLFVGFSFRFYIPPLN